MGGFLSCASQNSTRKGRTNYSVTFKPRDGAQKASESSLHGPSMFRVSSTADNCEFRAIKYIQATQECSMNNNNNKKDWIRSELSGYVSDSTHSESSSPSWKFWRRRLSAKPDKVQKSLGTKERTDISLLEKDDSLLTSDGQSSPSPVTLSAPLPDVVEKAAGIPRYQNGSAIPPPKPPRLFLFRTPSNVTRHSTESETSSDPIYLNSERVAELRSQKHDSSLDSSRSESLAGFSDCIRSMTALDMGENNNLVDHFSKNSIKRDDNGLGSNSLKDASSVTFHLSTSEISSNGLKNASQLTQLNYVARKPKIRTPELSSKRGGRYRRRSNDKGEMTRQRHIMNSISELLRQRLDPYPMLDQLKRSGILTNVDVQGFLGHHDRKSVCEGIVGLVGSAPPDVLPVFCDILSSSGNCTEIIQVLQVMREIDRIIHDVTYNTNSENTVMADEKNLNYEVGYLASDYSLKPLVELEKVRASTDKRWSKVSARNSAYSLLEGGEIDAGKNGNADIFSGLLMMSICVTGHNLSGQRAETLASLIRNHNCICELRMGKTQLCGEDIGVIAKALEDNRTVHSLDLRLNNVDSVGANAVAILLQKTKSLRHLNLSSSSMDADSIKSILNSIANNKTLTDLDLSFLDINDELCGCLKDMLKINSNLQKLRLRNNNLTAAGCYVLCEGLASNWAVTVLDMSRNSMGDEGVQALAKFLPGSSVTEVCLENCGITSVGCDALANLLTHCKQLKTLDVSTNVLLDSGVSKLIIALERTSSLQNLGLNMCGLTNDGFSKLLDVLEKKNSSIIHMKLCYNRLGREHLLPDATSENLRKRLRNVTSSKPKLRILLWGNSFEES